MAERPILFSGPMVRAILEGRKSQTRRLAKVTDEWCKPGFISPLAGHVPRRIADHSAYCPYGQPGDRLWVREAFNPDWTDHVIYKADGGSAVEAGWPREPRWRPSIFMPRWACRLVLEVTAVRVERLQEISAKDVDAEGVSGLQLARGVLRDDWKPQDAYARLWDSINAKRAPWASNPWVWVVEFRVAKAQAAKAAK